MTEYTPADGNLLADPSFELGFFTFGVEAWNFAGFGFGASYPGPHTGGDYLSVLTGPGRPNYTFGQGVRIRATDGGGNAIQVPETSFIQGKAWLWVPTGKTVELGYAIFDPDGFTYLGGDDNAGGALSTVYVGKGIWEQVTGPLFQINDSGFSVPEGQPVLIELRIQTMFGASEIVIFSVDDCELYTVTQLGTDTPAVTYLSGAVAEVRVTADVQIAVQSSHPMSDGKLLRSRRLGAPDPVVPLKIVQHATSFVLEDYVIVQGWPNGRPDLEARNYTRAGIGEYYFVDRPPAPAETNISATMRWLPTESTFLGSGGWLPAVGAGLNFVVDQAAYSPWLYQSYSLRVASGDEIELPAVIFDGDAWMELDTPAYVADAFTFVLVAVMSPNEESDVFGILESSTTDYAGAVDENGDPLPWVPADWGLRYDHGEIQFFAGATQAHHTVAFPQGRAVVMAISLDPTGGRFLVMSDTTTTVSLNTSGISLFDLELYLGRTGGPFDPTSTAQMAVLDLAYFDRGIDFDELADIAHQLNAAYGVSR